MPRPATTAATAFAKDKSPEAAAPVSVLTGTHFHSIDEKGRVIIPAKLRAALTERFWMMLDEHDNVALYNYETGRDVLEYCERLMALHPDDNDIADAVERITSAAELVVADTDTWRVQIPDVLRCYAKLDKEVVTVGVLNKAVLSNRAYWEEQTQVLLKNSEAKLAQAKVLRAAASGHKVEPVAPGGTGTNGTGNERTEAAPTSDGGRGSRLLTLQQLGR